VNVNSVLGTECRRAIDGAYALQAAHGLFLGAHSETVRAILRDILNAALHPAETTLLTGLVPVAPRDKKAKNAG
jgi:hypothetical protein